MSGDRGKRSNTPDPDVLDREARVVALRRGRMPWADIAAATGYANPASAQRAYRRALSRVLVATVDESRREELDMLDRLHAAFWRDALKGDYASGVMILRTSDARRRLLGLDAALRVKTEVTEATRERVRELVGHLRVLPPVSGGADDEPPLALPAGPAGSPVDSDTA
jgi:hypothetical protein